MKRYKLPWQWQRSRANAASDLRWHQILGKKLVQMEKDEEVLARIVPRCEIELEIEAAETSVLAPCHP